MISKLESHKASGCDRIPAIILKKGDHELAPILSKLYNNCLAASCFPVCWKSSSVVPVFKNSGEPSDPSNDHPISLLPLFRKVFEALINIKRVKYLTSHDLLSDKQYAFHFARSTTDAVMAITEFTYQALAKNGKAWAVAQDNLKVFYMVWHAGLLCKLQGYSVPGRNYSLIYSFLSNHEMKVMLNGVIFRSFHTNVGFPQGPILGLMLFLIFINDVISFQLDIYAGDTTIYSCLSSKTIRSDKVNLAAALEKLNQFLTGVRNGL